MEAPPNISCSNVTATNSFLIHILGSLGSSFRGYVPRCTLLAVLSEAVQIIPLPSGRLPGVASLLNEIFTVYQFTFLDYNDSKYQWCVAAGYLVQMADWMKVCFGCWITFHLFCFAVFLKNMKKLEPLYVMSSILVPIVVSSAPLITNHMDQRVSGVGYR